LPGGIAADVRISWDEGGWIVRVEPGASPRAGEKRAAFLLPGLASLHSHAFQRALAGCTEWAGPGADSFWSWRERMYALARQLAPADIEAIASMGCHAAPVVTALTVQDTCDVLAVVPIDPDLVYAQARTVLNDAPVAAIKIGLLTLPANAEIIAELLEDYPHIPLILDPVLAAGGGRDFDGDALADEAALHDRHRAPVSRLGGLDVER